MFKTIILFGVFLLVFPVAAQSSMSLTVTGAMELPFGKFSDPDVFDGGGNAGVGFTWQGLVFRELSEKYALGLKVGYTSFSEKESVSSSFSFTLSYTDRNCLPRFFAIAFTKI